MKLQFDRNDTDVAVLERPEGFDIDTQLEDMFEDPQFFNDLDSSIFDDDFESSENDWSDSIVI